MRNPTSVAKRALALELLVQRNALEQQGAELGADATAYLEGLVVAMEQLALAESLAPGEADLVRAPLSAIDLDDPRLGLALADLSIVLWALGRLPTLLTVDQIADAIPEITGAALLAEAEGDVARVDAAIASAKLRPREEIEPLMLDAAKANALAATAAPDKAHRDIPPGSVFYVLPWLLSDDHPWGVQVELRAGPELGGMSFTMDGVKLPS